MLNVGFLEKLLDGVAVEWKKLTDTANIQRGKRLVRSQLTESGNYAVYQNSMTPLGFYHESNVTAGTTFIISAGAAGEIGYSDADFWAADDVYFFLPISHISSKFLYYFLLTQHNKISTQVRKASVPRLSRSVVEKIQVPIPYPENSKKSLEIQTKIVRILDAFTAVTSELTSELTTRKIQYNYYRDKLLDFRKKNIVWKTLGEVANVRRGASPRPISKHITDDIDSIPWIKISDTSPGSKYVNRTYQRITHEGAKKSRILNKGDFILSNSMSFGRPYILGIRGAIHDGWASISNFAEKLNPDYLYHFLSSDSVQRYWIGKINSGSVSNLNADIIKALPVPIPGISEQVQIASILDKFDKLTHSITEGLPREIKLRQKQYEYYRGLLLSFPK